RHAPHSPPFPYTTLFRSPVLSADVGIVTEIGDGIAQIYGLRNARSLELLEFKGGVRGMALNLEEDAVGAVILGPYEEIREGDEVDRKSTRLNSSHQIISY